MTYVEELGPWHTRRPYAQETMGLFDARCRDPKAVNDIRSRALARKTGAGIWRRI